MLLLKGAEWWLSQCRYYLSCEVCECSSQVSFETLVLIVPLSSVYNKFNHNYMHIE